MTTQTNAARVESKSLRSRLNLRETFIHSLSLRSDVSAAAKSSLQKIIDTMPSPDEKDGYASLGGGHAGYAIFHGYLAHSEILTAAESTRHSGLMMDHLQAAVDGLPTLENRPDLIGGFTGVAWAANHLHALGALDECDELCDAVDEALIEWIKDHAQDMLCELITGLSGIGIYALGRSHRQSGRELLQLIVDALGKSAVVHHELRTWFNDASKLSAFSQGTTPHGCFNLGLSHGVPGAIAFLAQAAARNVIGALELATDATTWLLKQRRTYRNGSQFAYSFLSDPMEDSSGSRLAWCYGDLGISAALLISARCLKNAEWERSALEVARLAARREINVCEVMDAALCHGAMGNAHIFHRLYAATGEKCFLDATHKWLNHGLSMRKEGHGLAGFSAWVPALPGESARPGEPEKDPWEPIGGMLEGICGIGLALMGLLSPLEPKWDEVLMLNIPPMAN